MKGMNPMPNIRLCGLPKIMFAHIFGNDCYENILPAVSGRIEIDYIKSGSLNLSQCDNTYTAHENDIICNLYKSPLQVMSPVYHSHNTVCFEVDFDICTDGDIRTYLVIARTSIMLFSLVTLFYVSCRFCLLANIACRKCLHSDADGSDTAFRHQSSAREVLQRNHLHDDFSIRRPQQHSRPDSVPVTR